MLGRLRYPDWFDVSKKSTENEDEEKYLELRQELIAFVEPLVTKDDFKNFIVGFIDNRINSIS